MTKEDSVTSLPGFAAKCRSIVDVNVDLLQGHNVQLLLDRPIQDLILSPF